MQDLGTLQLSQKMTGVQLVAEDAQGNVVPSFNGLSLSVSPAGIVSFANQATSPATPAGSTYSVDIIAGTGLRTMKDGLTEALRPACAS